MLLKIAVAVLFPALFGYLILRAVRGSVLFARPEAAALAFGMGMGVLTLWMWAISSAGIPLNFYTTVLKLLPVMAFLAWRGGLLTRHAWQAMSSPRDRETGFVSQTSSSAWCKIVAAFCLAFIVANILWVFVSSQTRPVWLWDGWQHWAYRAKVFFVDEQGPARLFDRHMTDWSSQLNYPTQFPLSLTWFAYCLGVWDDQTIDLVVPLYYIALLAVFYFGLRRAVDRNMTIVYTAIMSAIPIMGFYASVTYADMPLAFHGVSGAVLLWRWFRERLQGLIILVALVGGLGGWIKMEGAVFAIINGMVLVMVFLFSRGRPWRQKVLRPAIYFVIVAALAAPWYIYLRLNPRIVYPHQVRDFSFNAIMERSPKVLTALTDVFFDWENSQQLVGDTSWCILWFVIIFVVIVRCRRLKETHSALILLLLAAYALPFIGYYFNLPTEIAAQWVVTTNRIFLTSAAVGVFLNRLTCKWKRGLRARSCPFGGL